MSEYNVDVISRSEREARIRKGKSASIGTETLYDFRNAPASLPVVQLPVGLPIYRMENFRTFTDQHKLMAERQLSMDFFNKGQETESVQQLQHDILADLARKGVADSIVPVIDVLAKEGQRYPVLISSSGVVVNGNRRLAAMRELFAANPGSYGHFGTVNCAVLPDDTTAEEILDIEASLQAQPETKLEYDWIGDAQLVSKMVALHKSTAVVASRLSRSEREIKNVIQALLEADLYLKDWAKAEGQYNRVTEDAEQLFKDLPKQLEGKDAPMKTASRAIAWTLFDHRARVPGRLYSLNAAFGKLAPLVLEQLSKDLDAGATSPETSGGDFIVDIDGGQNAPSYDDVVNVLRLSKNDEDVADVVIEAAQSAVETALGKKSGEAALKLIGQAHTKLRSVDISLASPETRPSIRRQLDSIQTIVAEITAKLDSLGS